MNRLKSGIKGEIPTRNRVRYTMSRVRSSGSRIERVLGRALWARGLRYRKQYPIIGKPDFVLVSKKIAIFCDSNFWHGYRWGTKGRNMFRTNRNYWISKIERNRARDKKVTRTLRRESWTVFRFWEHEIISNPSACAEKVARCR